MTDIIRSPTESRRRLTPFAFAIAAELLIWAGIVAAILFAVRACGS